MKKGIGFLSGMLFGAGALYLLDPDRGRRRRAQLRDRLMHGARELEEVGGWLDAHSRDLRNRARGVMAEAGARLSREQVDDQVLEARVRSAIGRAVSNPGAVDVSVANGNITLSGSVLQDDVQELVRTARRVRGVARVENRLAVHEEPADVPELQGIRP